MLFHESSGLRSTTLMRATFCEKNAVRQDDRNLRKCGLAAKLVRIQACMKAGPSSDDSPNSTVY